MGTKISALPSASSITTADVLPIVDSGATKKATVAQVLALTSKTAVNIMDYYQSGDGAPTVDGKTTKNIGPAVGRAYNATVKLAKHLTLWVPPCDLYGVAAWSWDDNVTIDTSADNIWGLTFLGTGPGGKIIVSQGAGLNEKLTLNAGGPASNPCFLAFRDLFFTGDSTKTEDCTALIHTEADCSVYMDGCEYYAIQCNDTGLLKLNNYELLVRRTKFNGCGNTQANLGALISFYSGIFGVTFEQVMFQGAEHATDPFGGTTFDKASTAPTRYIWARGDDADHAPNIHCHQCTFSNVSYGGFWANPDTGSSFVLQSVKFTQCTIRDATTQLIEAVTAVRHVVIEDCLFDHNSSAASVLLSASSCERLTMKRNRLMGDWIKVRANTGQSSVIVENHFGGDFDVTGASQVVVDETSLFDVYKGSTPDRCLRGTSTAGASVNLADTGANDGPLEYQIPATSSFMLRVELLGSRTDAQGNAREVHEISGHSTATTITIDHDESITTTGGFVAAGWSAVAFTDAGSLVLRVTCAGVAGQNVNFEAHIEGRSRPGHN